VAVLLGQEFLLSDMLNSLRGNDIVNSWRQIWHFVQFISVAIKRFMFN